LSPKNISSVLDLGIVSQHIYNEKSFLLDITKEEDMSITSTDGVEWSVKNQNKLASDPYFRGGKLGFTDEAGQTSLSIFMLPLQGEVRPVAVVVLHSKDWKQDTRTLLRWLVDTTKSSSRE
jgi:D-alanyl-D-alanine carboxypeptidase